MGNNVEELLGLVRFPDVTAMMPHIGDQNTMTNTITREEVADALFVLAEQYFEESNEVTAMRLVEAALTLSGISMEDIAGGIMSDQGWAAAADEYVPTPLKNP